MSTIAQRAHRLLTAAQNLARAADKANGHFMVSNAIVGIMLHETTKGYYANESGLTAVGDWNTIDTWDHVKGERTAVIGGNLTERLSRSLERLGIELEWADQCTTCDDCGALVRTDSDSYSWKPDYAKIEGTIVCGSCLRESPETYLDILQGNETQCETLGIDLAQHGYALAEECESGFFPGQNDSPANVAKKLRELGRDDFVFKLDENSQFYSKWSVWLPVKSEESEESEST